ncbi:MAG: 4Fe-4S binding protein [Bacteroidales bacterium OttesenSCG-928-I14]|jgi:NADH-quinone oxidoreductase subunit I|nr:4Fe-4S binding protein [Bacteroidales bacterium OttesenSCG-928-I14]
MNHIKNIVVNILYLIQGMYVTILNFFRKKLTEQYPENRGKVFPYSRFRGTLVMFHNWKNQHRCTACGICQLNCPNGTIKITTKNELSEITGSCKRVLDKYIYDVGSCTFCSICTTNCPQNAIIWETGFEHAIFNRSRLYKKLNKENSSLIKNGKI